MPRTPLRLNVGIDCIDRVPDRLIVVRSGAPKLASAGRPSRAGGGSGRRRARAPDATRDQIGELAQIRTRRGTAAARKKKALLRKLSHCPLNSAAVIRAYHDLLLFLIAFPDDAELRRIALSELERVAEVVRRARARDQRRLLGPLLGSGIAATISECTYNFHIVRWLVERFPGDVDLAWVDESLSAPLEEFRDKFVAHVARDSIRSHHLSLEQWIELVKGPAHKSPLAWLVQQFAKLPVAGEALEHIFEALHVDITWALDHELASTTFQRFPTRRSTYCKESSPAYLPLENTVAAPLPEAHPLSEKDARYLVDVARAALAVRGRETEATNYADPEDVTLFRLERGIDIALFGMWPDRRLPIESYFSYMVAKNRMPVAYGGGFVFLEQLDTGLHVFDAYRGGESAHILAQVIRTFCQHFGTRRIVVDSQQFGWGRPDGIRSGAFWLYYKLGLRPIEESAARLAREEAAKLRERRGYRSPSSALRRLTRSTLAYDLAGAGNVAAGIPELSDIAIGVAEHVGREFLGDHEAAARWATRRVARCLRIGPMRDWPAPEREAFQRLSLLAALMPDLGQWTQPEKRALIALMRAKGGARERDYALQLQRHRRFRSGLVTLAESGRAAAAGLSSRSCSSSAETPA